MKHFNVLKHFDTALLVYLVNSA